MEVNNKKWSEERFKQALEEALIQWPTGREVNLEEAVEYHKSLPEGKNIVKLFTRAERMGGEILVCAVTGVPTVEEQIDLFRFLEADCDILAGVPDAMTLQGRFADAEAALRRSRESGRMMLNGIPVVNHGVAGCRRICSSVNRPISISGNSSIASTRLSHIIALAAGATQTTNSALSTTLTVDDRTPAENGILTFQFLSRLAGWFTEKGVPMSRRFQSGATGAPTPPSIAISLAVIDSLIAAEQGTKYPATMYNVGDCVIQDVAGLRLCPKLCESYLKQFGYDDVTVFPGMNNAAVQWPRDENQAMSRICLETLIVAYGTRGKTAEYRLKTPQEAFGIPSKEATVRTVKAVKHMVNMLRGQPFPEQDKEFQLESRMIELETRAIVDKVLELGDGDVVVGSVKAVKFGVLDPPFAISSICAGKVLTVKDMHGAARFADTGNLPFSKEIIEYHREKVAERKKIRGISEWDMMVHDLRGEFI